jgi:holo-[acyl-carrier protein] synthase
LNVLSIGTEIVECLRIARMIQRHGELFINRVYTPAEVRYCHSRKQAMQHFTSHWAAKQAILKMLGVSKQRGIDWRDIEVRLRPGGTRAVGLQGGVRDLVVSRGIREILLTMSHCRSHAVAYVMAIGIEPADEELAD